MEVVSQQRQENEYLSAVRSGQLEGVKKVVCRIIAHLYVQYNTIIFVYNIKD